MEKQEKETEKETGMETEMEMEMENWNAVYARSNATLD